MAERLIIAQSAQEAVKAKTDAAIYMAGGTEAMRLGSGIEADSIVSIRRIKDMHRIDASASKVIIGAACTFQEALDEDAIPDYIKEALLFMASRTRRNMATIGGNIAVSADDSFLIPTLIAASADLTLMDESCNTANISVEDYVLSRPKYADRLITEISIPNDGILIKSVRSANTAQSHARLTASLARSDSGYKACIALKNSGIYVLRDIASAMDERELSEDEILELVKNTREIKLEDDLLYGGADYRRYLIGIHLALMYEALK